MRRNEREREIERKRGREREAELVGGRKGVMKERGRPLPELDGALVMTCSYNRRETRWKMRGKRGGTRSFLTWPLA